MGMRVDRNAVHLVSQGEGAFANAACAKYILATDALVEGGCTGVVAHNQSGQEGLLFHVDGIRSPQEVLKLIINRDQGRKLFTISFVTPDSSPGNEHLHCMKFLAEHVGFQCQVLARERIAIDLRNGTLMNLDMRAAFRGISTREIDSEFARFSTDPHNNEPSTKFLHYNFAPVRFTDLAKAKGPTP